MVEHICYKCNKKFTHKASYDYHINKKNPCSPNQDRIEYIERELKNVKEQLEKLLQKKDKDAL